MIKKVSGGYQVVSSKGKNLGGPYKTLDAAKKRLRQVEFFKTPQRIATGRSTAMRVLRNRTRTMSKPTRRANGRSTRTRGKYRRPRENLRRSTTKGIWHNWLMEENYL